jgi:hypothetical protein
MAKNEQIHVAKQKEPHPGAVHNMAKANRVHRVRCVGPDFRNGLYTLHVGNHSYYPNVTGSEVMRILQDLQDGSR